jgi:hypothetical protein
VRGVVRRIRVDRLPSFHQRQLLEPQVGKDTTEACASCRQVVIEE